MIISTGQFPSYHIVPASSQLITASPVTSTAAPVSVNTSISQPQHLISTAAAAIASSSSTNKPTTATYSCYTPYSPILIHTTSTTPIQYHATPTSYQLQNYIDYSTNTSSIPIQQAFTQPQPVPLQLISPQSHQFYANNQYQNKNIFKTYNVNNNNGNFKKNNNAKFNGKKKFNKNQIDNNQTEAQNIPAKVTNKIYFENETKQQINKHKMSVKDAFAFDENEFPSLVTKQQQQNEKKDEASSNSTPAVELSENTKKLMNNAGFLTEQIGQHYKRENELYYQQQQQQQSSKMSFKEVLEKPLEISILNHNDENESRKTRSKKKSIASDLNQSSRASSNDKSLNKENIEINEKEKKKRKRNRRRSKSSKKSGNTSVNEHIDDNEQDFELKDEDFPDLNVTKKVN